MASDSEKPAGAVASSGAAAPTSPRDLRRLLSSDLLAGGREAVIVHGQEEYRLRLTSNGKLILTK